MTAPNNGSGFFRVLFTPNSWLQSYRLSRAWDNRLNELMANHRFTKISRYTAYLGKQCVWVSNHPYASFNPCEPTLHCRPRRITVLRAMDKLQSDLFRETDQ